MKKLVSVLLTLALILSLSATAFAADSSPATNQGDKATSIKVSGTYTPGGTAATKISVEVKWDAMSFTYTGAYEGEWDPKEHDYNGEQAAAWTSATTADITVTNHSNTGVKAAFAFQPTSTATGTFTGTDVNEAGEMSLPTAVGTQKDSAPTKTATFNVDGSITESGSIGTITVTITAE